MRRSKILILGGTTEASALCRHLAADPSVACILSLAGRTKNPVLPPIPFRIGGFGGIAGLAQYLHDEHITHLIDATHAFATQISRHAVTAAQSAGVPLLALRRPPWSPQPGDAWIAAPDLAAAASTIGPTPRRVFLTIGQQELAAFTHHDHHDYLVRSVDPPEAHLLPPRAKIIAARGPFELDAETALLQQHRIEILVTKNAGGEATRAKLDAARDLALPVIMVTRPDPPPCESVPDVAGALAWIAAHAEPRGA